MKPFTNRTHLDAVLKQGRGIALRCPRPRSSGRNPDCIGTERGADGASAPSLPKTVSRCALTNPRWLYAGVLMILMLTCAPGLNAADTTAVDPARHVISWGEQIRHGGNTALIQFALSIFGG